jgi:hypothetical protein
VTAAKMLIFTEESDFILSLYRGEQDQFPQVRMVLRSEGELLSCLAEGSHPPRLLVSQETDTSSSPGPKPCVLGVIILQLLFQFLRGYTISPMAQV